MTLRSFKNIHSSDRIYINDDKEESFILNRLASGRFCLKPNLRGHRFFFRGQKKHYPLIQSSFARQDAEWQRVLSNTRCEEFTMLLRIHQLFMLFERGIHIETLKKPVLLEMNYYGLSQHYNFNTGLVDFTSDLLTSAFFAVTTNHTYVNQADIRKNEALLTNNGIKVDWHKRRGFTPDMLHQYYENINNGWWEEFCNNISFVDEDEDEMKEFFC